jgi:putative intracellular protease/amidase
MLAAQLLGTKHPVLLATPDGADYKSQNGMTIKADTSYADVNPSAIATLLIPGGDSESVVGNEDLNKLMRAINARGTVIGAICAGPFILAQAGILAGKKIAHGYEQEQIDFLKKDYFPTTELTDSLILVDGNIVTAKAQAFVEFAIEMLRRSGTITDEARLQKLLNFYKNQ